jgi:hypothetical protein
MSMQAGKKIAEAVLAWPEVTQAPHRFGGIEFRCRGKEIGHLHGDALCDIPLTRPLRDEFVAAGMAEPHHIHPESGWVSVYLRSDRDVANAIEIMRCKYRDLMNKSNG